MGSLTRCADPRADPFRTMRWVAQVEGLGAFADKACHTLFRRTLHQPMLPSVPHRLYVSSVHPRSLFKVPQLPSVVPILLLIAPEQPIVRTRARTQQYSVLNSALSPTVHGIT